jgi:hypothetical protein
MMARQFTAPESALAALRAFALAPSQVTVATALRRSYLVRPANGFKPNPFPEDFFLSPTPV